MKRKCQNGGSASEDLLNFIKDPKNASILEEYKKQGYSISTEGDSLKFQRGKGIFDFNPIVKGANKLIDVTTAIANKIGDIKGARDEYKQYLESIQPEITDEQDNRTNTQPIYFKTGGKSRQSILAEAGEVYESVYGDIKKIPDHMDTHDDSSGGVEVQDASRVLEDTGDKRDDLPSKILEISPDKLFDLIGVKSKKPVTHSKAFELASKVSDKEAKFTEKFLKRNVDSLDKSPNDIYAKNSMEANMKKLSNIKTKGEIFDTLFDHQESIKKFFNINDSGKEAQNGKDVYKERLDYLNKMRSRQALGNEVDDPNVDYEKLYMETLKKASREALGNGARNSRVVTTPAKMKSAITVPELEGENKVKFTYPNGDPGEILRDDSTDTSNVSRDFNQNSETQSINTIPSPSSQFKEPLRWYDTTTPTTAFIDALRRTNVKYNPVEFTTPKAKYLDPTQALQEGQESYNAALKTLPANGVGYANAANIFGKKYSIDNKILPDYDNANNGIWNQNQMQISSIKNSQNIANQSARETFEKKQLAGMEAQRQQLLRSMDDITTTIAQNAKYNREGQLLMKLFPNFNKEGNYNGNKYIFTSPNPARAAEILAQINKSKKKK